MANLSSSYEQISSVCRGCLATKRRMIKATRLEAVFKDLTGILISPTDVLPQWLCYECSALLHKYNRFRTKVLRSHSMLCQYVQQSVPFEADKSQSHLSHTNVQYYEILSTQAIQLRKKTNIIKCESDMLINIIETESVKVKDEPISSDYENNFAEEEHRIGPSPKRVRRSHCEERHQQAVTSSVAASSYDRSPAASLRTQQPLPELKIEGLLHYGSEEESESEDDELEAPVLVPRALRALWETPVDEEEEVAERAAPTSALADEDDRVAERAAPSSALEDEDEEVAERAAPSSEFYLPQLFLDFEWRSFPNPPIPPETRREPFRHTVCGPTITETDPYDIFIAIWDREIMEFIATETNRYAEEVAENMMHTGELCLNSRIVDWKDTTADELYIYMAIILAMGVVIKSRTEEYWNTEMDIFCTPGFRVNMSLRRFQLLNKCLHFNSTANMVGLNLSAPEAKLFKVQPVISHLNAKFSALYIMQQNIALDESLLQWKGWLDINQFIPNKAAAVGIKSYEICESATGYLWRFQIHAPKPRTPQAEQDADPFTASTPALVLNLIKGLEHAGYTLWMDNFYNSPALARKLKSIGFDCVGTLRTNRKLVPVELTNLTKSSMRPGQIAGFTSGDVDVMV